MAWYWAYGEDMDEALLKERCPSAKKIGIAKLPNARPEFFAYSNGTEPALDIVADAKLEMWGVLYFVQDTELMNVLRGAARGLKVRFRPVWDSENRAYNAYLLEGEGGVEPAPAPKEAMERLFALAIANDLPEKYCASLSASKKS